MLDTPKDVEIERPATPNTLHQHAWTSRPEPDSEDEYEAEIEVEVYTALQAALGRS